MSLFNNPKEIFLKVDNLFTIFFCHQEMSKLLKATSDKIVEIQNHRESKRRSEFFNHLSAVSESIPALGWVSIVSEIQFV